MYNVSFATGSRADYGIVRNYLQYLKSDKDINLDILVTGTHLEEEYGYTKKIIEEDGYDIDLEVELNISEGLDVCNQISKVIAAFGDYFSENKKDLLIILGDRYEMIGVAIAAAINKVKILHIHGGEATYGNYDEFIRHSITKMSLYHFAATEEYRKRIIQLGEEPERVFYLGALGAENCKDINPLKVEDRVKSLCPKTYFVIVFHPETLKNSSVYDQISTLLSAISSFENYKFVFIGSNADTDSNIIRREIQGYSQKNKNAVYFENLHSDGYHYLLKNSKGLIGNSSSGLIEAPSLGIKTINIGDRQKGRVRGNSVLDIKCDKKEIEKSINTLINDDKIEIINPYETEDTAKRYFYKTKELLKRGNVSCAKEFYDCGE